MQTYIEQFAELTQKSRPHRYQELVADHMLGRRHIVLRAPTGAGKTLAVLIPFLLYRQKMTIGGMIYVLPLRTLVEAVFEEARRLAEPRGLKVAMQTGERADAEFFHDADIIVTTFDQLLSGLLCDPYGLSRKLWNINAAAIAGKLVVFDEFHLMDPDLAFASALFGVQLFKDLCLSVWMTATATSVLTELICKTLDAVEVRLSNAEEIELYEGRGIRRGLQTHWNEKITASEILRYRGQKVLAVVNTVGRAQALFDDLKGHWQPLLLHSRFFSSHRREKQSRLKEADFILATQVIEAGVDITCNVLLTELAPVNAVVQRAGRCARFPHESGIVHVYEAAGHLPYTKAELDAARTAITDTDALNPTTAQNWIEQAHRDEDRNALTGFSKLTDNRRDLIRRRLTGDTDVGAAAYIRRGGDNVRVFIVNNPEGKKPQGMEAIQVQRGRLRHYRPDAWVYDGDDWVRGGDIALAYAVALPPKIAGYTKEAGLKLGTSGIIESPTKEVRRRPGWSTLHMEPWDDHTQNVIACSRDRMQSEGLSDQLAGLVTWTAKLHDIGKLQYSWQEWAHARQAARGKVAEGALAHTDYDSKLHKGEPRPPRHASASALYGASYLDGMPDRERSAILLAVLGHHGGTLKGMEAAERWHITARQALQSVDLPTTKPARHVEFVADQSDNIWISFDEIWRLAAILSRVLRLSDQKATAESSDD